jgi:glucose/arabinose dehydrogenase
MCATRRGLAVLAVALGLLGTACSGGQARPGTPSATGAEVPSTAAGSGAPSTAAGGQAAAAFDAARVRLVQVASLQQPVAMALRPGERTLYVAEQTGRVRAIRNGQLDPGPVLDVSSQIVAGGEQGLLGLAFSPDGRFLYVDFTDRNGDTHVTEFAMRGRRADPASGRLVLEVDQPFANHNGGQLAFGPDRRLYVGLGDGGGGGDPDGNGQSLGTLLGKILRIDPRPGSRRPYRIPAGNPFAGRAGARPEIWDYGLRNPWRFSFDPATGDLWIGDVGQDSWEEIDHEPARSGGRNYGWDRREGAHRFEGDRPPGAAGPLIEYGHQHGACTVIGGPVYRGRGLPGLRGAYLYGDYCAGWVRAVRLERGRLAEQRDLGLNVPQLSSFGVGADGELYALSLNGPVFLLARAAG